MCFCKTGIFEAHQSIDCFTCSITPFSYSLQLIFDSATLKGALGIQYAQHMVGHHPLTIFFQGQLLLFHALHKPDEVHWHIVYELVYRNLFGFSQVFLSHLPFHLRQGGYLVFSHHLLYTPAVQHPRHT